MYRLPVSVVDIGRGSGRIVGTIIEYNTVPIFNAMVGVVMTTSRAQAKETLRRIVSKRLIN